MTLKTSRKGKIAPPDSDDPNASSPVIEAKLKRIIFQAPNSSFIIGAFVDVEDHSNFTAKGPIFKATEDMIYQIRGHYEIHPRYGKQLAIDSAEPKNPDDKDLLVTFLSMDYFDGIGKKTAEKIYDELGDDLLQKIQDDPDVLVNRCHLSEEKKNVIMEGLKEFGSQSETFMLLMRYGLSERDAQKIMSRYTDVRDMLDHDCFEPLYRIYAFPYQSALKLADGCGLPRSDIRRLSAALFRQLSQSCFDTGSTYLTRMQLYSFFQNIPYEELEQALNYLVVKGYIDAEEDRVYSGKHFKEEWTIARKLREHTFKTEKVPKSELRQMIEQTEEELNITYDPHQKEAIELFFDSSVMILNGGPGTGKSTTVKGILELIDYFFPDSVVQLCAPTGKASKRLGELSDEPAKTIHSLLKWDMENNRFGVLSEGAEALDCDFVIIDEFSMVDTHLFANLLKALPRYCRILLIGDEDQLESVGEGRVLQDLIASNQIPMISLTTLFRSAKGSGIAQLAKEIREGAELTYEDGVEFIETDPHEITAQVRNLAAQCEEPESFQVLAPQYHRGAGINIINQNLQTLFNPFDGHKKYLHMKDGTDFIVGDKVILLKNDSNEGIYNGDIGVVEDIDGKKREVIVNFDEATVGYQGITAIKESLRHAWCLSVHKSQGSEYQEVCVVADPSHQFMLTKKLLYTAISRAKKKLTIIGSRQAFETGCRTNSRYERQTTLKERMESAFS